MDEGLKASQMIGLDWNMSAKLLPELTAQHNGDVYKIWMSECMYDKEREQGWRRERRTV